ncbi:hypothetical protein CGRA01v4_00387 [Colletotrichum graminicola]|nr:hypothetical protein CGRA01v4_00387 [Colletotrichum graminicola]
MPLQRRYLSLGAASWSVRACIARSANCIGGAKRRVGQDDCWWRVLPVGRVQVGGYCWILMLMALFFFLPLSLDQQRCPCACLLLLSGVVRFNIGLVPVSVDLARI